MPTAQVLLDKLNTAIETLIDGGLVQAYTISGRNLQRMNLGELTDFREKLQSEVNAGKGGRNFVEFANPQ